MGSNPILSANKVLKIQCLCGFSALFLFLADPLFLLKTRQKRLIFDLLLHVCKNGHPSKTFVYQGFSGYALEICKN